jgi:hypothetical protein
MENMKKILRCELRPYCRAVAIAVFLLLCLGVLPSASAQSGVNQLSVFQNYFVTGDYVVAGWTKGASANGYAQGTISVPDTMQAMYVGPSVKTSVPVGADIVAAYLFWATVEGNQTTHAGQLAYFNGYPITGQILGNPNAPTSWSSGGCSGNNGGSKTMVTYVADVHPFLPIDNQPNSPTFGATTLTPNPPANGSPSGTFSVKLADSGSNGNAVPIALGATLVVIYRVLSPAVPTPLNSIVIYSGSYAPSNAALSFSQTLSGFYQQAPSPVVKITHIVANGQPNKQESVLVNNKPLPSPYTSLYGASAPAFPGLYNGSWDNPTWDVSNLGSMQDPTDPTVGAQAETTTVVPSATNSGCVSWGTIVMSTTVQSSGYDGLLDFWKTNQGYLDVLRDPKLGRQWVALPNPHPGTNNKDIYVEVDWLDDLNDLNAANQHTHLPNRAALDAVGDAFAANPSNPIHVHFDLGPNVYQGVGDPYVVQYSNSQPPPPWGGNLVPESAVVCSDNGAPPLCPFPNQATTGWKGGFEYVKNSQFLDSANTQPGGNFQPGRANSYHYVLFGHALGLPKSFWSTIGYHLAQNMPLLPQTVPALKSITVNAAGTATITLLSPPGQPGLVKPTDCLGNSPPQGCYIPNTNPPQLYANYTRVSIGGALNQIALNGTYNIAGATTTGVFDKNNVLLYYITTVQISTSKVPAGTYQFDPGATNSGIFGEPQLAVTYLGPVSASGESEFGGGGDSLVTLGLWGADDVIPGSPACQPDPTQSLMPNQAYCANGVGTIPEQTGTLMHELGHSLALTHGGVHYPDSTATYPFLPTSYDLNCKPNFLSVMNYLFQVRGFVDGGFDYSSQTLPPLNEAYPYLSESIGLGNDTITGQPAAHLTRWYAPPNKLDIQLGAKMASSHCDGTPLGPNDVAEIRVDGSQATTGNYSAPLDFNHDLTVPDAIVSPGVDLNYNGNIGDAPFSGFNDWNVVNLQQVGARENAFGYSAGGVNFEGGGVNFEGGGVNFEGGGVNFEGGGVDANGGGVNFEGGGVNFEGGGVNFEGGGVNFEGGGVNFEGLGEQSEDLAAATADPPTALTCTVAVNNVPGCTGSAAPYTENGTAVPLSWNGPNFGQTRTYTISRATGSYTASQLANLVPSPVTAIATVTGAPPTKTYVDSSVSTSTTYTYMVTDTNKQGTSSGPSNLLVVTVGKAIATVTLNGLTQIYTGTPRAVTATTNPAGLAVSITYNGSATAPTAAGTYTVVGTINDPNYQGSATGTLTISKATATVTLGSLTQSYTGTPRSATATTSPAGLTVNFTYNGSATAPTAVGTYTVVGTISNANYQGTATGIFTISMATVTVSSWPKASNIILGQSLASSTLTGGSASVPGMFVWTNPALIPPLNTTSQSVTFVPTLAADYNTVVGTVKITVTGDVTK